MGISDTLPHAAALAIVTDVYIGACSSDKVCHYSAFGGVQLYALVCTPASFLLTMPSL